MFPGISDIPDIDKAPSTNNVFIVSFARGQD